MKIPKRLLICVLLLCLVLPLSLVSCDQAYALGKIHKQQLKSQLLLIIKSHPRYVWGGTSLQRGVDCSGYLWLAFHRAGLPFKRTTALAMAQGQGGWVGKDITLDDADEFDVIWWTFEKDRPHGHVGITIRRPGSGVPAVTHASPSRGIVVVDDIARSLLRFISKIRRLSFGDSPGDT